MMGTKRNPGRFDCHIDAGPDEPIFTFRASDDLAPWFVREWARQRSLQIQTGTKPLSDRGKVSEAEGCATAMEAWYAANRAGGAAR